MKIVLAGPPRSGKSCLREGLKRGVRSVPGAPYPYVITACPDGEGAWFQETVSSDPQLAAECKATYKSSFTPKFMDRVATSVERCSLPLTLVDIGGIPSAENVRICAHATHIVLLAGTDPKTGEVWSDRLAVWYEFARKLGLTVVAEIFSDYHGQVDEVKGAGADGILRGSVHHLERGEDIAARPMVRALAEHLVEMVSRENE